MARTYRGSAGLALLVLTAVGVAGCGSATSPRVASLGISAKSGAGPTTTLPKGNPTQLLDAWASCMRARGETGLADPTVDTNGVIHIHMPSGATSQAAGKADFGDGPASGPCGAYLTAASIALRGGHPVTKPDPAELEKYSECMRANGIPDFPDPTGGGLSIRVQPGSDLNPNNPAFQTASKLCAQKTGVPGLGGTPPRGAIEATSGNGPPGGPGSGSNIGGIATGGAGASAGSIPGG